jgi:hypothetical protein
LEGVVDFGEIGRLVTGSSPKLLVGAVEVRSGEFEVFRDAEVTAEGFWQGCCSLPLLADARRHHVPRTSPVWSSLESA